MVAPRSRNHVRIISVDVQLVRERKVRQQYFICLYLWCPAGFVGTAPELHGPLIPGDLEREAEALRKREGVSLPLPVVKDLRAIVEQTSVPLDEG